MNYSFAYLDLPIHKQGDDLNGYLAWAKGDQPKALREYARALRIAATLCDEFATGCETHKNLDIDADTHTIQVEGPRKDIDALCGSGILHKHLED